MVQEFNPYAAPTVHAINPIELEAPTVSAARFYWAMVMAGLCVLGSIPASAIAVWDIETILGSGPILLAAAVLLAILARPAQLRQLWTISAASSAIVVGIFLWINLLEMGPANAQVPVGLSTIAGSLFLQLGWLPIYRVWTRRRSGRPSISDWNQVSAEATTYDT